MIVVVAEKPSVGRDIARVLGCRTKGEGFLQGEKYCVTWAVGHLITLNDPHEVDPKYKKWRAVDLPMLPDDIGTKVIPKTRAQFSVIKKLICDKQTERVICATDAGREGELIFRLIYEKSGCNKPVDRLWISSMTDAAILEGFDTLKPASAYDGLYYSAACRSQADWLVGMNASRAFTLRYNALLSVGRVQTPTLAILVSRAKEIREFVPEGYFTVTADFGDYSGQWFDLNITEDKFASRIKSKETADSIAAKVKNKPATVASVTSEHKRELPPPLYDLTSLQREANKALGFTASKTLKVAQSLYETRKCITYPRTDSRYLPDDMAPRVQKTVDNLPAQYSALTTGIPRVDGALPHSKRVYDDSKVSDHHAIIPTPQRIDPGKLEKDEQALFDMVAKRFIAVFYPAYEYDAAKVITVSEEQSFKSTGRTVTAQGWKAVYPSKRDEEETALPPLENGSIRTVHSAKAKRESTKPPVPHTDASLLFSMEHAGKTIEDEELREQMKGSGLGTPATRAAIIERIIQVGYVARKGKALLPTQKGEQLISVVPPEIASPEMTGQWEKALTQIAQNKRDKKRFMDGIQRLTRFLVDFARGKAPDVFFEREAGKGGQRKTAVQKKNIGINCPVCGGQVQETDKAFGCAQWRNGCKFTLWKNALTRQGGPVLTGTIVKTLLEKGEVPGSTGKVTLEDGLLSFYRNGEEKPVLSVGVLYEKSTAKKAP